MAVVCPTVTAEDLHEYRRQLEVVSSFAERIHLDFMDGLFTSNESVELKDIWLPDNITVDLHLMYMRPDLYLENILKLKPKLVIVHAEAEGNYAKFASSLHEADIKVGVCLLQDTSVNTIKDNLGNIDHVLLFSGDLGHFGGHVDLSILEKAKQLKELKPNIELGWDGGINDTNALQLAKGGIDVLNVGGFIQQAEDSKSRFDLLKSLL